jgi:hypothetical protein
VQRKAAQGDALVRADVTRTYTRKQSTLPPPMNLPAGFAGVLLDLCKVPL